MIEFVRGSRLQLLIGDLSSTFLLGLVTSIRLNAAYALL